MHPITGLMGAVGRCPIGSNRILRSVSGICRRKVPDAESERHRLDGSHPNTIRYLPVSSKTISIN
jgi:hypothetical protein